MLYIGLIREGKVPADNRVALTPAQCKWIHKNRADIRIIVQTSPNRCFSDAEYQRAGIEVKEDLSECNFLFGIKEVPVNMLMADKTYLFFSHTKKLQPYNKKMLRAIVQKNITLIDYECLEHSDGTRIIGFGFFAGVVGAHNGMMAFGKRTGNFELQRVNSSKNLQYLIHTYFGLHLPAIKIAVTGSGRVAHGILEIMNLMGIHEVEPEDYISRNFEYPVYVHLKGSNLYRHRETGKYSRMDFHQNPRQYSCLFSNYLPFTDIIMNGVYWDADIPRLFEIDDMKSPSFKVQTIADITDDAHGSIPVNLGDATIEDPVYGVDKNSFEKTAPYLKSSVDIMAVGNLPNELPKDASRYFGEQLIKYIMLPLIEGNSEIIDKATIVKNGKITKPYDYMSDFAYND